MLESEGAYHFPVIKRTVTDKIVPYCGYEKFRFCEVVRLRRRRLADWF
jgi:hypothetical protein